MKRVTFILACILFFSQGHGESPGQHLQLLDTHLHLEESNYDPEEYIDASTFAHFFLLSNSYYIWDPG
jgi:hypothetical protein